MSTWKHANTHIALGGWVARCRIGRKGIAVASQVLQRLAGHAPAVLTSAVNRSRTSAYACSSRPCTPNRWTCTQSNHGRLKKLLFALICWIIGACSSGIHGNRPARQAPSTFLMMRVGPSCTDARVSAAMCKVEKISCLW